MFDSPRQLRIHLALTALGLIGGLGLQTFGATTSANALWIAVSCVALFEVALDTIRQLLARHAGVDLIAILAMAGALAFGEYLAAAVIALMLVTGATLEQYAAGRAERALSALLKHAPRTAHRMDGQQLSDIPVDAVAVGDQLLVKEADSVPVDGVLLDLATLDESALTGESRLVEREPGAIVSSGVVNAGGPFRLRAMATAEASTYAGIIRLVRSARERRSPFVRLADHYAALFVPLTLVMAGAAWALSGEPIRALAVLVVATPCPLLLAAPIAVVSGISRCARRGIIVRDGGALEALAQATVLFCDKTGTLTIGAPRLADVATVGAYEASVVLNLAASLEQVSSHVLAAAVVRSAIDRGLLLSLPTASSEIAGGGMKGTVDGHEVLLGSMKWVSAQASGEDEALRRRLSRHGGSSIVVALDGVLAGALLLNDPIRPDAARTLRTLRRLGVREIVMVTGDREEAAATVGAAVGVDRVLAEQSPESKVAAVATARTTGATTVMIGDGINDAAALATASVGVAMGARGATASSEAAGIVIAVDRLDRLEDAVRIAQRTHRIARESVLLGMCLAFLAMGAATMGLIAPVGGALLQEGIDAAAILWALRALTPPPRPRIRNTIPPEVLRDLRNEHRQIDTAVERLREAAVQLDVLDGAAANTLLTETRALIQEVLLPHERADERRTYPMLSESLRGDDPLALLSRAHFELELQAREFALLRQQIGPQGPTSEERKALQELLFGLHAILRLHNTQEDELFHQLADV